MKIPKNMSEEETLEKINTVINRIAPRYTFNGYDINDIKQESFIICLDALSRYDEKRPLENFLSVNLSNRLKNFVRDNFGNSKDVDKKKISSPLTINELYCSNLSYEDDVYEKIQIEEIKDKIDSNLDASLRADYLKFLNNITIPKQRRDHLIEIIKGIINEDR